MRRNTELLQKWAVEKVPNLGTPKFLFLAISGTQKEWKVTSPNRSFSVESIYKETTVQNGGSQASTAIDTSHRLGYLHRSDKCLSSYSDSFSVKEIPSICFWQSGLPIYGITIWECP